MTKAPVFQNDKMQVIYLPDDVALPKGAKTVEVISVGVARVIALSVHLWDTFFDGPAVSDDFMEDRNQPTMLQLGAL